MRNRCRYLSLSAALANAIFLVLLLAVPFEGSAKTPLPPVKSVKAFINKPTWLLEITWFAKDAYEDKDVTSKVEMTATARYILKQRDKKDAWGSWHVESVESWNLSFSGFEVQKPSGSRIDYAKRSGPAGSLSGAIFDVGGNTPGYQLFCNAFLPIKIIEPAGQVDLDLALSTDDLYDVTPCTGPLPRTGLTIHGSLVVPMAIPPIGVHRPVRVGIQFVLEPLENLAPLGPPNKKKK